MIESVDNSDIITEIREEIEAEITSQKIRAKEYYTENSIVNNVEVKDKKTSRSKLFRLHKLLLEYQSEFLYLG